MISGPIPSPLATVIFTLLIEFDFGKIAVKKGG
jgi:hypothetical protein